MNLIYDRTAEDVERALTLAKKAEAGTLTDAEKAEWLAGMKGCYNASDLNRVEAAVKQLAAELNAAGYAVEVEPVLKGGSRLPSGYTQVEYIRSSGTQAINTGITGIFTAEFDICFASTSTRVLFGQSENAGAYLGKDASNHPELGGGVSISVNLTQRTTLLYERGETENKITANGLSASRTTSPNETLPFYLFMAGLSSTLSGDMTLWRAKFYKSGILVRDYIPCKNPDGTVGLYDLANSAFYTNAGSGTFVAGPEISVLEDREWRESDTARLSQWRQYLANVQALRDAYYTLAETGELPDAADRLDYIGANTIEKILADIDLLIDWMKSSYRRCGTFRAGKNAQHLLLAKGVN